MTLPAIAFTGVAESAPHFRLALSGLIVPASSLTVRGGAMSMDSFVASIAGTTLSVGPGRGAVQGATSTSQGVYLAATAATWTQVLAAASSQDRIDLVYLRVWDDETDSSGLTQVDFVYLQGTPSGSPVAPSIPAGQSGFRVCTVSVPHTGSPAITQAGILPYTAALGGVVPAVATTQPGSPFAGMLRQRLDRAPTVLPGPIETYDGAAWQAIVPDGYGRGLVAAPIGTTSIGTAAGTTETLDSVLGTIAVALISGRRYRVVMTGLVGNAGAAGDTYVVRIRDSGSTSAPINTSALVAEQEWVAQASGSLGRTPIPLEDTFISGSTGTHTLGFFAKCTIGSSNFTPLSPPTLPRRLYVYDVGNV